jgi:hypothetical protein
MKGESLVSIFKKEGEEGIFAHTTPIVHKYFSLSPKNTQIF